MRRLPTWHANLVKAGVVRISEAISGLMSPVMCTTATQSSTCCGMYAYDYMRVFSEPVFSLFGTSFLFMTMVGCICLRAGFMSACRPQRVKLQYLRDANVAACSGAGSNGTKGGEISVIKQK